MVFRNWNYPILVCVKIQLDRQSVYVYLNKLETKVVVESGRVSPPSESMKVYLWNSKEGEWEYYTG
jgi:hypothetical protein